MEANDMNRLSFDWVIDGQIAGHRAPSSEQDLLWLRDQGIRALVRMADIRPAKVTCAQIAHAGMTDCDEQVPDFTPPKPSQIDKTIGFIIRSLSDGRPVGVSCRAGLGRTGTILACYLVSQGCGANLAISEVRAI
ncbi:MAG: dual specificity protein phosphatase family protein, partial [Chloroflexi bacterium]|nr:dual specificity protein phosphatase family protein [Chloroflexota bacterium]